MMKKLLIIIAVVFAIVAATSCLNVGLPPETDGETNEVTETDETAEESVFESETDGETNEVTETDETAEESEENSDESGGATSEDGEETTERYFTVSFDSDGGTAIESQSVKEGEKAVRPADPEKVTAGNTTYTFKGWYIGETEYDFNSAVTEDITITAKWASVEYGGANPIRG